MLRIFLYSPTGTHLMPLEPFRGPKTLPISYYKPHVPVGPMGCKRSFKISATHEKAPDQANPPGSVTVSRGQ